MKYIFFFSLLFFYSFSVGQSELILVSDQDFLNDSDKESFLFVPELSKIKKDLQRAPRSNDKGKKWVRMQIPFPDGSYHDIEIAEAPVVADKIYKKYPQNRSYKVRGIKNKYISGRMSITDKGMSALLYTESGNVFIEPENEEYHKAYEYDSSIFSSFSCGADHSNLKPEKQTSLRTTINDERKFIIAIASTGEFSAKHNNNLATINAKIVDYLTLLNTIYERDLAITFELAADNDDIIFFNPATDGLDPSNNSTRLSSTQSVINSNIGSGNYDIGHAFYEMNPPSNGWWGSGVASLGVVCSSSSKARGWSGCGGNYPNSFWMGIFAHEVAHQFQATHTFYGTSGNCGGSQRSVGNGVEPGSGNSLMSYEGSCGASGSCSNQNITPQSSFYYFHSHSIDQIQNFVSGSGSCFTSTDLGNSPPVITMPTAKTIPQETPFYLSATAVDPDGDPMLFSWEEVDTDNLNLSCPNGAPNDAATSTTAPLFRSFDPSPGGSTRYFPQLDDILDNTQTMGEILPEVGRGIDMRFTARGTDANGISGVAYEDVTITVAGNSGPFEVTTASTPTGYLANQSVNIEWLVGNANTAPISCSSVNILWSNDGGQTFPITLASNTPNDGIHSVNVPANGTEQGRIKIEAVGNIFFTINKSDISIISDCVTNSSSIVNDDDVTADAGDPSLNLELTVGDILSSASGILDGSDPSTNLIGKSNTSGNCLAFTNSPRYETYILTATKTDVYNFSSSSNSYSAVMNIYQDGFVPPALGCQNWLTSNFNYSPISFTNPLSLSLIEGDVIELVVSGFNTSDSGNYTVNFSSNGTGELIEGGSIPNGYVYKYVIYNDAGFIIEIEDEADLSDEAVFYNDIYTVKGLLVLSAANLAPYINQSFSSLQSDVNTGAVCGEFSSNDVTVTVNGCNAGVKTVTSPLDDGNPGSLRSVIENACPGDMIQFDQSLANQTIVVNSEIVLNQNGTISGAGISNLTLSGNNSSRIFNISSGVAAAITGLSLVNGYALNNGGALVNNGNLTLENVTLSGNNNGTTPKAFTNNGVINISDTVNVLED